MGEVVRMKRPERVISEGAMPEKLSKKQVESLLRRCAKFGYSLEEVHFATQTVRAWYDGDRSKRKRSDWVAVIRNAVVNGWGLRGFKEYQKRGMGRRLMPEIEGRRNAEGNRILDEETIAKVVEALERE